LTVTYAQEVAEIAPILELSIVDDTIKAKWDYNSDILSYELFLKYELFAGVEEFARVQCQQLTGSNECSIKIADLMMDHLFSNLDTPQTVKAYVILDTGVPGAENKLKSNTAEVFWEGLIQPP
jgi:hypothetical protein